MPHGKLLDGKRIYRVSIREMSSDNDNDNDGDADNDNDIRGPSECIEPHLACRKSHTESPTECGEVVPILQYNTKCLSQLFHLATDKERGFHPLSLPPDTRVCPSATFAFNVAT